jgi:hypothetical protein
MSISSELTNLIIVDIKNDVVSQLMERFDNEIVPLEDEDDPVKPSVFREEFKSFLEETITSSMKVSETSISFGVGDDNKLGFDEELDKETTDGLKIIGTILQGISGEYVLVTKDMVIDFFGERTADEFLGRTGTAYLMKRGVYNKGVRDRGWEDKSTWKFSNFSGIPRFFDDIVIDIPKYINKLGAK